ncbi:MAG: DUF4062 domain-containing protein [Clostridiales bacterium]|nr:DUF4062 domain-containing protein [Clostridiales bacterium]
MAAPRVFISSTFYDLKQVRNNIGDFITSLGYEPVMHEKSGVAYTQTTPLENDCYHELASCDIVVCIIGNHFGSKSLENDLSITMNEIQTAIKHKKKVYIFIANDVYTENRTYLLNKDTGTFKSAYTDDIKIHEFIANLKESVKNHFIAPFETTNQIIDTLRAQFAGLLQNLLQREASMTEAKTAYDLQQSADDMREIIKDFEEQTTELFTKFGSTILMTNRIVYAIKKHIGMDKSAFFASNLEALDEFMKIAGFESVEVENPLEDARYYVQDCGNLIKSIILKNTLVDENQKLKDVFSPIGLNKFLIYQEKPKALPLDDDSDIPF